MLLHWNDPHLIAILILIGLTIYLYDPFMKGNLRHNRTKTVNKCQCSGMKKGLTSLKKIRKIVTLEQELH